MKYATFLGTSLVMVLGLVASDPQSARAQDPEAILENYAIRHGGNQAPPGGVDATLSDRFFGNGTARARIRFEGGEESSSLSMSVRRLLRRNEVVPALLVFRVEVRGFDVAGVLVYARDLRGFTFGDSRSGSWSRKLDNLPADVAQVSVTFFGNYE